MTELWGVWADTPAGVWADTPAVFIAMVGLLGLLVGSFLNVVIHRLPIMMEREWRADCSPDAPDLPADRFNLVVPRSRCPGCGAAITAYDNIPVLSYLLLHGRCRGCAAPISKRYPLIECVSGVFAAITAYYFGPTWACAWALILVWSLLALACIDFDTYLLPDSITQPILWLGILVNSNGVFVDLSTSVYGAVAGYLLLWGVYWLFKLVTGKEGMGYGDFKLLALLGAWLGWQVLPIIIVSASLVGAVVGLSLIAFAGHAREKPIPFGPYLACAGLVALWWGDTLIALWMTPGGAL